MLAMTETAAEAIKEIVSTEGVPDSAGLRIASPPQGGAEGSFEVTLAAVPADEDQVVEEDGAQVFLEPQAAEFLDDKLLDVQVEGDQVMFTVGEQG